MPKYLDLTPEELARIQRRKDADEANKVEPEWAFVAEFGYYYGWGGVQAILDNQISFEQADRLIRGARRIRYSKVIDHAIATQTAVVAAHSKKPRVMMKKGLESFMKEAK